MVPCPSQAAHRPPPLPLLKEKRAGVYPRVLASGSDAKSFRISSHTPRNVAGTLRGVLPMGDWSTASARFTALVPLIDAKGPGCGATSFSARRSAG
jgi:hypothetical protein